MKTTTLLAGAALAALLAGCGSQPRQPDWQLDARTSADRFVQAFLAGSRAADAEWRRSRAALASTAQPDQVARAELLRCAVQVASLDWPQTCAGFEALRGSAAPEQAAYADYLQGRWPAASLALLPPTQRRIAEQGLPALAKVDDPLSRLLGAAVLLRSGNVPPPAQDALAQLAVDTASAQGWRRPLMAWLGLQLRHAQAAGQSQAVERIRQRLALLEESTS